MEWRAAYLEVTVDDVVPVQVCGGVHDIAHDGRCVLLRVLAALNDLVKELAAGHAAKWADGWMLGCQDEGTGQGHGAGTAAGPSSPS